MSVRDLAPGTVVDERYEIVERVGSGGMADVYCAQDRQLGRRVALKLLHRRFAADAEFVERFRREASAAAGLSHTNVVGVYDRGEWDGTYYIAMEFLEGATLKQIVGEHAPLAPLAAIDITIQVLRAARFAHSRGVIHRDLKPHNVILDEEGRAKVTDFGIARAGASDMTETGSIMGTAQYLSPEQAQGLAVSAASDIYSIGIMLYELLTGRLPFEGDSAVAIAMKQVSEAPVPPSVWAPGVPPELDAVVLKALEKDPAHRFVAADAFISALEQVRATVSEAPGQSTAVFGAVASPGRDVTGLAPATGLYPDTPYGSEPEPERGPPRRWWIAVLIALVLIGGGVAAFLLTQTHQRDVPKVVGTSLQAATAILQNAGFDVSVNRVVSAQPVDMVLRQDPQPGASAKEGSTVSLIVSGGPGQAGVPDVAGLSAKDATKALEKAGFKVVPKKETSDTVATGNVTRTVPDAGQQVDKGTSVTIYVSSGPQQVTVPGVEGQNQGSAASELGGLGLNADVTEKDSDTETPGTVLSQSPAAGSKVDKGSSVALVVAREPQTKAVPDVTGSDPGAATQALTIAGFNVVMRDVPVTDSGQDGIVVSQNPRPKRKAKKGSTVTISIGRFAPPPGPTGTTGTTGGGTQ